MEANPWTAILRGLRATAPEPRLSPTWQYYHTKHTDLVTKEYTQRGGSNPADSIKMRNGIAREQFKALPPAEQSVLEQECKMKYEEEAEAWDQGYGENRLHETTPEMEAE